MPRRLTSLLALLAICATVLGWSAASASAAKHMEVALSDDVTFLYGLRSPFTAFKKAKALHVTWIRVTMSWGGVLKQQSKYRKRPKHLRYQWRRWDDVVRRANNRGIAVQMMLTGPAPRWASGDHKRSNYKPNVKRWGDFVRAAAWHFRGRVWRWEVWNEPNLKVWLSPYKRSPKIYRALYETAYRKIKAVNKKNQVLIGETSPYGHKKRAYSPLRFLRAVTCVNGHYRHRRCKHPLRADGYAHHAYDYTHKPGYHYPGNDNVTIWTLPRLTKALYRLRRSRALLTPKSHTVPVYITEYGYFSGGDTKRSRKYNISKKQHAKYLVKSFNVARRNKHVKQMLQYLLVQPPKPYGVFQTQIMSRKFKPYPAYTALRKWAAREAKRGGIKKTPAG